MLLFCMMANQIPHNRPFLEVFRGGLEMAGYVFIIESFVEVLYEYLLDTGQYLLQQTHELKNVVHNEF